MKEEISEQNKIEAVEQIIKSKIYIIRGHKVMLDADLAELYGVLTKNFNKAVQRNLSRFP
ncbi:MAG: ORF6N domain-containing protein, partial [Candidatus Taylorbacteria bacterium]|nr:ORF6N domain-containing protein [Candidatus Taylorbacteria bacterium]